MTDRQRLPNRRASETFTLECAGLQYVATVSRFDDGCIGEIFLSNHKAGSHAEDSERELLEGWADEIEWSDAP